MIPESKLKADCTPDVIKKMIELAEGFHISEHYIYPLVKSTCINYNGWCAETTENFVDTVFSFALFPLLIHRAVEGWNKIDNQSFYIYMGYRYISKNYPEYDIRYAFKNYQPSSFTPCECACLHCLIEVLG